MFESLSNVLSAMLAHGAIEFYAKRLAANDNSKNQFYLGGGFEALNIIPHGNIETDYTEAAGSVRRRDKAPVEYYWIDSEGIALAPDAQLILYPKYPEVRLSGLLRGASRAPNELVRSRDDGRVLVLGIIPSDQVLGYVASAGSGVAADLNAAGTLPEEGVFLNLARLAAPTGKDPRELLLEAMRAIHQKGWIPGQRLHSDGTIRPYSAQNAGGYTLEAELGVIPNGRSEPDYRGWEIKQFSVKDFKKYRPLSAVTLMTPEPTSGLYKDDIGEFMKRHGYSDTKGRIGRVNFGGQYRSGMAHHSRTGLALNIVGYNLSTGLIDDMDGSISLVDKGSNAASAWTFKDLLSHWNRKHNRAAYIPSMSQGSPKEYRYGGQVQLGVGTDFLKFMRLLAAGSLYLDPSFNMQNGRIERPRHQFRVSHQHLGRLYDSFDVAVL